MPREPTVFTRQFEPSDQFKHYAVVMEGDKQEPNYFKALKSYYALKLRKSRIIIEIVERKFEKSGYSSPKYLIQHAQEVSERFELQEYDELWIVFDAGSLRDNEFEELKCWKAQKHYHHLAYSNPCFELWLILHLTEYETVENELELAKPRTRSQLCKKLFGDLRQKHQLSGHHTQYLIAIPEAIERAKKLDTERETEFPQNICTRVYRLVENLTVLPKNRFNPETCHNEKEVESKFVVSYLLPLLGYHTAEWQQQVHYQRLRLDFLANQLVIETKHPDNRLTDAHVQQLTEYMKIANLHYGLLTNARELRIYEQINQKCVLIFRCFVEGIENKISEINRLIGKKILTESDSRIEQIPDNLLQKDVYRLHALEA